MNVVTPPANPSTLKLLRGVAIVWAMGACFATAAETAKVDFNRDVRVILSDKCFLCHGPDESTRQADLRLDDRDAAEGFGVFVAGSPETSELIARITSDDPDVVMPPPETGKKVTAAEREILRTWIQQGAVYEKHWAFVPPSRPAVPDVKNHAWPRNDIDRFVLARLESSGLKPSPPADSETLLRRLHLDLIGLPPSIEDMDAYSAAHGEAQTRDVIQNLIASEHFGERWGKWWLDAARYADSAGYEKDMQRQVWFYRDWVIRALNRDMPYDQFVIEQVAGDLIPGATQDQVVATGFLRNSMTNEEGGADPEQFRTEAMFDRVDAIGKAILGLTTQCAQCHTHKYDPISHREYYQMFAALNDFHEACATVYTPEQYARRDRVLSAIDGIHADLKASHPDWRRRVSDWADSLSSKWPQWSVMRPETVPFEGQKFGRLGDGSIISESYAPSKCENDFSLTTHVGTITAVRLDALLHPQLPRGGPGRSVNGTGALSEFQLSIQPTALDADGKPVDPIQVKFVRAMADLNTPRSRLPAIHRQKDADADMRVTGPIEYAIDGDETTAWTTDIGPGRSNQPRHAIFVPESPIVVNGEAVLTFKMVMKHGGWNSDDNQNCLIGRYRFSITDDEVTAQDAIPTNVESILRRRRDSWTDSDWNDMFVAWSRTEPSCVAANRQIENWWKQFPATSTQLVVQRRRYDRETHVLLRGDFLQPGERVRPGVPAVLNAMPNDDSPARLRFARWMVADDAPTTARVIVNRIWQAYFGHGIVASPEDFGYQSAPPTHPELLDYLAVELMRNNWSLQHIHRLIVDSATYRQSAVAREDVWREDPLNQSLARGPRFRASAEMVRDIALTASGLLNPTVGGRSVYPPTPGFLFLPPNSYGPKNWFTDTDNQQYRRSLYVHLYRSSPYPPLQMFDAPKGDAACVRRPVSNTPLQALVLLNEPQFVDAARALASRVVREFPGCDPDDRCDQLRVIQMFRLCTSRIPTADELAVLRNLLDQQRHHFATQPSDYDPLLGVSAATCRQLTGLEASELASWMVVARTILNLDETIGKP